MTLPLRIVSLISSATEILFLLGLNDKIVGVSHECDYPSAAAEKPRLTRSLVNPATSSREIDDQVRSLSLEQSTLYTIDVERLTQLAPDLIITQAQCDVCAIRYEDVVAAVRESPVLSKTEVLTLNPNRIADVLEDIRRIGTTTGALASAEILIAQLNERMAQVRSKTSEIPHDRLPRVACLEWIDPPMLAANWTPELVRWAGGIDGLKTDGRHSTYADWQQIAQFDPEVVVVMPCGFELDRAIEEAQVLAYVPQWHALSAVTNDRVFAADGNAYFNRSGPRLVDSLEILAHLFHPDVCPSPLTRPHRGWRRLTTRGTRLFPEDV